MFALIFLGLLGLVYGYTGWRILPYLPHPWNLAAILVFGILLFLPILLLNLRSRPSFTSLADPLSWVAYSTLGFCIVSTSLLLVRDAIGLIIGQLYPIAADTATQVDYYTFALAVSAACWGFFQARRTPAVVEVDVPVTDLHPTLAGLRIVQISDLHVGPTIKAAFVRKVVDRVNELQADIIVFTGDLADGSAERLAADVAPLRELNSALGVYSCTGNHEYYSGVETWTKQSRQLGFDVLNNEGRLLEYGDRHIGLAGVTDYSADEIVPEHASDPQKALQSLGAADLKILLAHQPRSIEAASQAGYHLQLSGHTHGGQFFPWNFVIPLQQPFVAGLHKYRESWIYVHRGTGYWGPPLRLGAPSEIAVITFRQAGKK